LSNVFVLTSEGLKTNVQSQLTGAKMGNMKDLVSNMFERKRHWVDQSDYVIVAELTKLRYVWGLFHTVPWPWEACGGKCSPKFCCAQKNMFSIY